MRVCVSIYLFDGARTRQGETQRLVANATEWGEGTGAISSTRIPDCAILGIEPIKFLDSLNYLCPKREYYKFIMECISIIQHKVHIPIPFLDSPSRLRADLENN